MQDCIEADSDMLRPLLQHPQAVVMVAGLVLSTRADNRSSKQMPDAVEAALAAVCGADVIRAMMASKRYQMETWS